VPTIGMLMALALNPWGTAHPPRVHLDVAVLAPVDVAIPAMDALGTVLANGIVVGDLHFGVDGQPTMPFLSAFLYAQEIRVTQIDPLSLAGSLMATVRADF
jgi:hypothetical protein